MRNLFLIGIAILAVLLGVFVLAQVPTSAVVVNAYNCTESDGGLNYEMPGSITGSFWWSTGGNNTNGTQQWSGTISDVCVSNTTLFEGVCGSSIHPNYRNLAGVVVVDCSIPAGGGGNSTNSTYRGLCGQNRCY